MQEVAVSAERLVRGHSASLHRKDNAYIRKPWNAFQSQSVLDESEGFPRDSMCFMTRGEPCRGLVFTTRGAPDVVTTEMVVSDGSRTRGLLLVRQVSWY